MVRPTDEADSRSRSLDEVRNRLAADWTQQRALDAARAQAEQIMSSADTSLANDPESGLFRRTGSGLDHAAAGLIADAAFSQAIGEAKLVETGDSVIVVRTESVVAADQSEQAEMSETMQNGLNRLVGSDLSLCAGAGVV